jgi:CHASE3 domain sensor protein
MIEDGTLAGEGLTFLQTFTYFFVAPTVLFVVISFFSYITAKEVRAKSKRKAVNLTSIE